VRDDRQTSTTDVHRANRGRGARARQPSRWHPGKLGGRQGRMAADAAYRASAPDRHTGPTAQQFGRRRAGLQSENRS